MPAWSSQPWQHDSNQPASAKPGTVQGNYGYGYGSGYGYNECPGYGVPVVGGVINGHLEWLRSVLKAAGGLETTAAAFPMGSATAASPSLHPIARFYFCRTFLTGILGVRTILPTIGHEQLREQRACATHATLYRPYRNPKDRRRLVVGEARRADKQQGLALNEGYPCRVSRGL
jgi:hypothetical protein